MATERPRNIDTKIAAALLYGDLGTSKAYVIGLAFALVGYASVWFIAAVSLLTLLIGLNYMVICKYYPNGGGVYASVRKRSELISLMGAFFLVADYFVTAALSSLSAFHYLGASHPTLWSGLFILLVGLLNYLGPRRTGRFAFIIGLTTFILLTVLILFSLPYMKEAWHNVRAPVGSPATLWSHFVGVIVALSGIEAIANTTSIMKLNPGSTNQNPLVTKTSTKAIAIVIIEVALYTTFFAFAASAISSFQFTDGEVNAPGNPNVRDFMLRYMAKVFSSNVVNDLFGDIFAWVLSLSLSALLLSAVNTAINGLIALQYLMASDGKMPANFQRVNKHGVPMIPLVIATLIPMILVLTIGNVQGLATLYAIGFVGAIAMNLGATSTDFSLPLKWHERLLMALSFLIMLSIEITLFIEKAHAAFYAAGVIILGLILRMLSFKPKIVPAPLSPPSPKKPLVTAPYVILCPIFHNTKPMKAAIAKSNQFHCPVHLLFIKEQITISEIDREKTLEQDRTAMKMKQYAAEKGEKNLVDFHYVITDSAIDIIAAYAMRFDASELIIDHAQKGRRVVRILKGRSIKQLKSILPENILITIV